MKTLDILFQKHVEFTAKKFPESTYESSLIGLQREIKEVMLARNDYYVIDGQENRKKLGLEYVDCFMYLVDSFKRAGFLISELPVLFEEKSLINDNREWIKNEDNSYSHI